MTVYVILCERGFRYVGKVMPSQDAAASVQRRFVEHCTRRGAVWTSLHRPVQLVQRLLPDAATERDETLAQMRLWGIERVRGAGWCQLHLSPEHVAEIHRGWVENFDLCRRCGSPNHMMDRCDSAVHHLTLEPLSLSPAAGEPAAAPTASVSPLPTTTTPLSADPLPGSSTSHLDRIAQKRLEEIRQLVPLRLYREILATSSSEHIQNSSAFVMECYNEVHRSAPLLVGLAVQGGLHAADQVDRGGGAAEVLDAVSAGGGQVAAVPRRRHLAGVGGIGDLAAREVAAVAGAGLDLPGAAQRHQHHL